MGIGKTNVGGGGKAFAFIVVTYPSGSTCTCTDGTKVLKAKGTTGSFVFNIPYAGTWTVSCTDGTDTATEDIVISTKGQSESVDLSYRVPSIYQTVEYIEPTGTQYIGNALPNGGAFRAEVGIEIMSNANAIIFGRTDNNDPYSKVLLDTNYVSLNVLAARVGTDTPAMIGVYSTGYKEITLSFGITGVPNKLTIDEESADLISGTLTQCQNGAAIFALKYGSGYYSGNAVGLRLHYLKWYDSENTLIRELIPVYRKSDNVAGLWDVVNKVFYTNNGTGSFIVGGNI